MCQSKSPIVKLVDAGGEGGQKKPVAIGTRVENIPSTTAHIRRDVNMTVVVGCMLRSERGPTR
jgi:hypothetical protein